jgi:phage-related protein
VADIPNIVLVEKNKLDQTGCWPWLLALTPAGSGLTYRYTNNTEPIGYHGNTYNPMPFRITPIERSTDGSLSAVQITVTDVGLGLQSVLRAHNGLRGASVTLTQVNTNLLAQDFSGDAVTFQVSHCQNKYIDLVFYCGVPGSLKHRVPEDQYLALQCRHDFRIPSGEYGSRCGYTGKAIVAMTLAAGSPVELQVTGHGFATGDSVRVYGVTGITPSLNADYTVTNVDADHLALDSTDGADYSGSYISGAAAGFAKCPRILTKCRNYERNSSYGGIAASRADAVRLAV